MAVTAVVCPLTASSSAATRLSPAWNAWVFSRGAWPAPSPARLERLRILTQALVHPLQCGESLDLCSQVSPPLLDTLSSFASLRPAGVGGPSVTRPPDPPVRTRELH